MRVYLSGKMGGRLGQDILDERAKATELLEAEDIEVLDPAATEDIEPLKVVDLRMDYNQMKRFVAKDEFAVRNSHILLILTGDAPSDGTWLEAGLAHYEMGIPVIVVSQKRASGELMGFMNVIADAIFPTVEEAVKFIAENFNG